MYLQVKKVFKELENDDDECPQNLDEVFVPSPAKERPGKENDSDEAPRKSKDNDDGFLREKQHAFCLTGVEKYHLEKDIFKMLRKYIDIDSSSRMPLKSIFKKRG